MKISLPEENGKLQEYRLTGNRIEPVRLDEHAVRTVFSAAHVVADPYTACGASASAAIDWEATLAFRRYLTDLGLGIAEAMDTSQRGMGLDWPSALELISQSRAELPDALIFNGVGTDQLDPANARNTENVVRTYLEQIEAVQKIGGRLIIMASRALAKVATGSDDYHYVYSKVLDQCEQPVILHWLGEMFDPQLQGYWGYSEFEPAMDICIDVIQANADKIDGIKISLLDKHKEILMRRRLPEGVKMYTGDDFNYPKLIAGDEYGYSHALLGIFDPLAPIAAQAIARLSTGDKEAFHALLDPTVMLARKIFMPPTQHYKTGVVFLAWLNGFQEHFVMLAGAQAMRPLNYFVDVFKLADKCGALQDPQLAVARMKTLLSLYGI